MQVEEKSHSASIEDLLIPRVEYTEDWHITQDECARIRSIPSNGILLMWNALLNSLGFRDIANTLVGGDEMQVKQVTLEILREMEILSDNEGRYIFDLAGIYLRD